MKCTLIFTVFLIFFSCGGESEPLFTPEEMELISSSAGALARNLAFLPDSSDWSPLPDENTFLELESIALHNSELWPVFFRAAADTAAKLEQQMLQAQQEQIQSEHL